MNLSVLSKVRPHKKKLKKEYSNELFLKTIYDIK